MKVVGIAAVLGGAVLGGDAAQLLKVEECGFGTGTLYMEDGVCGDKSSLFFVDCAQEKPLFKLESTTLNLYDPADYASCKANPPKSTQFGINECASSSIKPLACENPASYARLYFQHTSTDGSCTGISTTASGTGNGGNIFVPENTCVEALGFYFSATCVKNSAAQIKIMQNGSSCDSGDTVLDQVVPANGCVILSSFDVKVECFFNDPLPGKGGSAAGRSATPSALLISSLAAFVMGLFARN